MPDDLLNGNLSNIVNFLAAAGALGTAAFGLVDAFKAFGGGVSNAGFGYVRKAVAPLIGSGGQSGPRPLGKADILATLRANWLNGVAKADQKATAKSLIRLCLTPDDAPRLAEAVGIDAVALKTCAEHIRNGDTLTPQDFNILGRFDAIVSAILDEGYERADQQYRNSSKFVAALVAIVLATIGGAIIFSSRTPPQALVDYFTSPLLLICILVGAISTPLAPIAKDLSSSLAAAVKAVSTTMR